MENRLPSIRVLSVISSSQPGGAERYFAGTIQGLGARGVEVHIVCPPGPMTAIYAARAKSVTEMGLRNPFGLGDLRRLRRILARLRPDVAHTHLWNADCLGAFAARGPGAPKLLSTVYGAYYLPTGTERRMTELRRRALSGAFRGVYSVFDQVIAVSRYVRDDLAGRRGLRLDESRIAIVDPPFEGGVTRTVVASNSSKPPRIVCLANFFTVKGQEFLLKALPEVLSLFPAAHCDFIGDGPERGRLEAVARAMGIESAVKFHGSLDHPEQIVARASVLVLPSLSEGLPHSILEAWSLGVPVVASSVGGIPEAVRDGYSGLLTPPGDITALSAAIVRVLCDVDLARHIAEGGAATLRERFSVASSTESLLSIYHAMLYQGASKK